MCYLGVVQIHNISNTLLTKPLSEGISQFKKIENTPYGFKLYFEKSIPEVKFLSFAVAVTSVSRRHGKP